MSPISRSSGSANGDGFGDPDHAVEHRDGNGRFALLAGRRAGAELRADQRCVGRSRSLRDHDGRIPSPSARPIRPLSALRRMWRSRGLWASGSFALGTADARGGMTTSGGGSCCRAAAAWWTGPLSEAPSAITLATRPSACRSRAGARTASSALPSASSCHPPAHAR